MKIKKLDYQDNESDWKLEPLYFTDNPTLLVGISGAGKTQILRGIYALKLIAQGHCLDGVKWNVEFLTNDGILYRWEGEFEPQKILMMTLGDSQSESAKQRFNILSEKLYKNDILIVDRTAEQIIFKGIKTPKLSPNTSAIYLLKQEEDIRPAAAEIDKIIRAKPLLDFFNDEGIPAYPLLSNNVISSYKNLSLAEIKNGGIHLVIKLFLVSRYFPEIFLKIKDRFLEIFDSIEDVRIDHPNNWYDFFTSNFIDHQLIWVNIKEKGVKESIQQPNISSGMMKTLMYISELYLCPPGSVILLDEFENSLGVNCIESLIEIILENQENVQFIMTSHHPYIINNIPPQHWKIVTRKGGVVRVKKAEDFGISKSRHKAFIDLINILEDYPEGLEEE
ncbi:MAG: hypothetical protein Fur0025_32100 [Oscillatoriaceae cyanobacterium]